MKDISLGLVKYCVTFDSIKKYLEIQCPADEYSYELMYPVDFKSKSIQFDYQKSYPVDWNDTTKPFEIKERTDFCITKIRYFENKIRKDSENSNNFFYLAQSILEYRGQIKNKYSLKYLKLGLEKDSTNFNCLKLIARIFYEMHLKYMAQNNTSLIDWEYLEYALLYATKSKNQNDNDTENNQLWKSVKELMSARKDL